MLLKMYCLLRGSERLNGPFHRGKKIWDQNALTDFAAVEELKPGGGIWKEHVTIQSLVKELSVSI